MSTYDKLRKELQSVSPEDFTSALLHVLKKQDNASEADDLTSSFATEFPALISGAAVAFKDVRETGMGSSPELAFGTGLMVGLIALKEMIDTTALNDIPTLPTIE